MEKVWLKHVWIYIFPTYYVAIEETRTMCNFSHVTLLMSHMTCLNNTHEYYYKLPCNELEKKAQNMFGVKLCSIQI